MRQGLTIADLALLGGGSGVPLFPPDSLAGLVRWYKADSFSLADSDPIGGTGVEWVDQSPTAPNDATQGTAGDRPLFRTNIFGSMPAIQFANDFLSMPDITLSGELTVIVIGKCTADSVILGKSSANIWFRLHLAATNIDSVIGGVGAASDVFTGDPALPNMYTWRRDAVDEMLFRERNVARNTAPLAGVGVFNLVGGTTGIGISACHVGEICVYTQNHSDADIDKLYAEYFKIRWGLV